MNYVGMLQQFHVKYDHYFALKPQVPTQETINLRFKLINEECKEVNSALYKLMNERAEYDVDNLTELADGLADLLYVTFGTALAFGLPIDEIFAEVQRSNMTKSTEKNEYGKTIKGLHWSPPNIKEIIEREMKS